MRVQTSVRVGRDEAQVRLAGALSQRVRERGPPGRVECEARGTERRSSGRAGDDPKLAAAAREREPGAVLGFDQRARSTGAIDDEPGEDRVPAGRAAGTRHRPAGGGPPRDDDVTVREKRDAR